MLRTAFAQGLARRRLLARTPPVRNCGLGVELFAAIAALLGTARCVADDVPLPTSQTESQGQIPVEVYKAPFPKDIARPDCAHGLAALSVGCRTLNQGFEGWAEVNFMVDPSGKPFEVTVTHSTGNKALDGLAVKSIEGSTFVPGTLNGEPVESGFEIKYKFNEVRASTAGAKSNFVNGYKAVKKAVDAGDRAAADAAMDRLKITNLYEDAYFGLASYFYARKWGDERQQLDALSRAVAEEDQAHYLPDDLFKSALQVSLQLQVDMRLYAEALATYKTLQKAGIDEKTAARLRPVMEQLQKIRSDGSA